MLILYTGNAETDQQWARPPLDPSWDPETENLVFQQIDIEEGQLDHRATVRLFGVTEVCPYVDGVAAAAHNL